MCPLAEGGATSISSWTVVVKNTSRMSVHLMAKRWSRWRDIFLSFFCFLKKRLCRHFFSTWHHCAYSLCFATPKRVKNLWTGEPSVHLHTVALPFHFVLQPVNSEGRVVIWVGTMSPSIYVQVVNVAAFCLTKFKHFNSVFMGLSFDIHTKNYTPSKWAFCLVDG